MVVDACAPTNYWKNRAGRVVTKTSAFFKNGASGFVYAQPYELSFR